MAALVTFAQQVNSNLRNIEWQGIDLVLCITTTNEQQVVIPKAMGLRQQLLEELHCTPLNSHPGVRTTVELLYWRVQWPQLCSTVTQFVCSCKICQRVKDRTTLTLGQLEPLNVPTTKFSDLSLDFISDLLPNYGCNCLLVVVDCLRKYNTLIPRLLGPNAPLTLTQVAQLLFRHIICKFGVLSTLVSDYDPCFILEIQHELQILMQYRIVLSTANHPQSDGQTEIMNRTVGQLLRTKLLASDQSEWATNVPFMEFGLNTMVSASTAITHFTWSLGY